MDPSFDGMLRALSTTTRVNLIYWQRCKRNYKKLCEYVAPGRDRADWSLRARFYGGLEARFHR